MGTGFHGGFGTTHGANENHKDYIENTLPKTSPITIPSTANIKEEKKNGYDQVKYTWTHGEFSYTSRWHTRTPNAPKEQGESWVVQRDKPGIGYGKMRDPENMKYSLEKTNGYPKPNGRMQFAHGRMALRPMSKRSC